AVVATPAGAAASARGSVWSSLMRGSRLPFSSTLAWEGARLMAARRSSSVMPRSVRSWRMRFPIVRASSVSSMGGASMSVMDSGCQTTFFYATEEWQIFCFDLAGRGLILGSELGKAPDERSHHEPHNRDHGPPAGPLRRDPHRRGPCVRGSTPRSL